MPYTTLIRLQVAHQQPVYMLSQLVCVPRLDDLGLDVRSRKGDDARRNGVEDELIVGEELRRGDAERETTMAACASMRRRPSSVFSSSAVIRALHTSEWL